MLASIHALAPGSALPPVALAGGTTPCICLGETIAVSLDPSFLPYYLLRTSLRMLAALVCSLLFSFVFAAVAARYRTAEKILMMEADRRFEELADQMRSAGNTEVQEFFQRMAEFSRRHLSEAKARSGSSGKPAIALFPGFAMYAFVTPTSLACISRRCRDSCHPFASP